MSDPLQQLADSLAQPDDRASALAGTIRAAQQFDPDAYAKAIRTAAHTGVAPTAVLKAPGAFEGQAAINSIDPGQFVNLSPRTASWLVDSFDNAAVGHDDAHNLARIEKQFGAMPLGLTPSQVQATQAERLRVLAMNGQVPGGEAGSGLASMTKAAYGIPAFLTRPLGTALGVLQAAGKSMAELPYLLTNTEAAGANISDAWKNMLGPDTAAGGLYRQGEQFQGRMGAFQKQGPQENLIDPTTGQPFKNPDYAWWGRGMVNSMESIPGALMGFGAVGPAAPLLMGTEAAQGTYEHAKVQGASTTNAAIEALISGGANYFLMSGVPPSPVAESFWGKGLTWAARGTGLGLGMNAIENTAARLHDPNRPLFQGAPESMASMLAWEGIPFAHAVAEGQANKAFLVDLAANAAESKLRDRAPDMFRDFVRHAAEGSGVEDVGIPAEAFTKFFQTQGMDPREVAGRLQIPNFDQAVASGTDLMVPVEQLADKIAPHPKLIDGLIDDMRVRPGDLTQNELRAHAQDFSRINAEARDQADQATAEIPADPSRQSIFNQNRQNLVDAGFEPSTADSYAQAHTNAMVTLAGRAGLDPLTLQDRYGLQVFRPRPGEEAAQGALFQEGDEHQGYIQIGADRKMSIGLLQKADLSTFLHESGHAYLEMLHDLANEPGASEQLRSDLKTVRDWLGAKDGENVSQDQHEQFARANEAYLMEGKAPSEALQGAFSRFKGWLSLIYQKITNLGVKLNPEIRSVFDRVYASDKEIEDARDRMGQAKPFFATAADMGVSPAEFEAYRKAVSRTVGAAKEDLARQVQADFLRQQNRQWKAEAQDVRKEVADRLDGDPVYKAWKALVDGRTEDGTAVKLDRAQLVERIGEDATKALKRSSESIYTREGGLDLDTAAELLGFQSGDALAQALHGMEFREQAIERLVKEEMTRRHGDILTDGTLADKAAEAMHNRFREDALALEIRALQAKAREARPLPDYQKRMAEAKAEEERQGFQGAWESYKAEQARQSSEQKAAATGATQLPPMSAVRDGARSSIEQMPVRSVIPYSYMVAERKASREAFDAMARGDYQAAAQAKHKELLNHFLFHEALKVRQEADRIQTFVRDSQKIATRERLGKAGGDFMAQQDSILNRYEFQNLTNKELDRRRTLAQWAQDQTLKGEQPAIDPKILDETRKANWREIPIIELRAIKDALTNIQHLAGRENELRVGETKANWEEAKDGLLQALNKAFKFNPIPTDPNLPKTQLDKAVGKLRGLDAMLVRMEQIVNWADKDDVNGAWHKFLWNPIADAAARESDMARDITAKLQAAMEKMPKDQRESLLDRFEVPGLKGPVTRKYIISMLFNMGNEENRQKMTEGMGWANNPEIMSEAFRHLNAHDARFVQDTWNTINELWPHIADLEHRMTGLEPIKVDPRPFELDLADGRFRFDGGYYPLKGDPLRSSVGARQEFGSVVQLTDKGFERPRTSQGHTETRSRATYPLLMDFESILGRHVTQVIQDVTHREAVVAAYKVISDPEIRRTLTETIGEDYMRQFLPWLRTVVNDRNQSATQGLDWLSKWMGAARRNTVTATMGYKLSTALVQYTGITRSLHYVGKADLLEALGQFATHPQQTISMVRELSGEMRNRAENVDRDYREMMHNQTGKNGFMAGLNEFAFHGIAAADAGIGIPTWLGAYNQAMKAGKGKDTAVMEADRAVRLTQPTAGPKDLPAIMRQNDAAKLLTMFYGHFSVLYQNLRDTGHKVQGFKDAPDVAASVLRSILIPAIAGELILNRGPSDDENKGKWAILKGLHFAASSIPLLRDIAKTLTDYLEGKKGDYRFSPVVDMFKKNADALMAVAGSAGAAKADHPLEDTAWKTAEALGYDFGVPGTSQAVATGRYLHKVAKGETNDTPTEAAAHLAFGYHKPK